MNYSKKVIRAVAEDFERKRADAENERVMKLNKVYSLCPEIKAIDSELTKVGSEIVKATLMGKEGLDGRISAIRERNLALQKKRAELLNSLGYDEKYTDTAYECPICKDSGYVGVKLCSCYRNALIEKAYESSGLGNLLKTQSFDNFDFSTFGNEDRENVEEVYGNLITFCDGFPESNKSILLAGGTGLGKTHLSTAVAKRIIDKGYDVVYETAQNIFTDFDRDRFENRFSDEAPASYKYLDCDLLIIDDLGSEIISSFSVSCLYNIVNTRVNRGKPILISTNLSAAEMRKIYQDRITSRLFGEFVIMKLCGSDYRRKKLKK